MTVIIHMSDRFFKYSNISKITQITQSTGKWIKIYDENNTLIFSSGTIMKMEIS